MLYCLQVLHKELSCQPCSDMLASKDRQLLYHGNFKLLEFKSLPVREVVVFLFTDLLLLTHQTNIVQNRVKKTKKEVWLHTVAIRMTSYALILVVELCAMQLTSYGWTGGRIVCSTAIAGLVVQIRAAQMTTAIASWTSGI